MAFPPEISGSPRYVNKKCAYGENLPEQAEIIPDMLFIILNQTGKKVKIL